ncbi:MAG: FecR domain-containing protein, partial [Muribaculaceae bacterium]|nr:FecR domain-containing protein [Muribaculaceae bacterium]
MTQISKELMEKFINNTCTDSELEEIRDWLRESDENVSDLFGTELTAMLAFDMNDDRESSRRIARKIRLRIIEHQERMARKRRLSIVRWGTAVAAMIAIAVTLAWPRYDRPAVKMIRIVATDTQRTVSLPDSSTVDLNLNSTLLYPEYFASNERVVELSGDGYFTVSTDKARPFIVKGRYLDVEVTGTEFYFNSRDTADNIVNLFDGTVEVIPANLPEGIMLIPGQRACYDIETGLITVESPKTTTDITWRDHIIPFENANIEEIGNILYRLYGIPVQLDDNVDLTKTYSGGTIYYNDIDST